MKNRQDESLRSMTNNSSEKSSLSPVIITSPSDIGVRRNSGRNGSRYAPKAITEQLLKLNDHMEDYDSISVIQVSSQAQEKLNFEQAQLNSSKKILSSLEEHKNNNQKFVHIGGGHDHVYPLLKAINDSKKYKNILILNIDAHCDTRVDQRSHSGTPFRDFDLTSSTPFHLIQYGIHIATNSKSTLTPLKNGSEKHFHINDLINTTKCFSNIGKINKSDLLAGCPFDIDPDTAIVISLDSDAIDGANMKGVSAVNGLGLPLNHTYLLINTFAQLKAKNHFFGIYEYNPVYDDLSNLGARSIARIIYDFII